MIKLPSEFKEVELQERLEKARNYYMRGAITKKEFIYVLTQITGEKELDAYIDMILDIIETNGMKENSEIRKKIIEKVLERLH
jgi:hypothetical protein